MLFQRSVETFAKQMLNAYDDKKHNETREHAEKALLTARGELLSSCGRFLLLEGKSLEHASKMNMAGKTKLDVEKRLKRIADESKGKFGKLEHSCRKDLVERQLYEHDKLPTAVHLETIRLLDEKKRRMNATVRNALV